MEKVNKIQKLFKSQELNPAEMLLDVAKAGFGRPTHVLPASGLLNMFRHPRYEPVEAFYDFSNGKEKDVCLLGKGVLYDSGGYNIKTKGMEDMYIDKFGALTALTIAKTLKLPVRVFFVVNLITDTSIVPGTILTSITKKKVRVVDTDAEGRIGLAHLIESSREYKKLITFATLTGHSVWNVGEGHAEIFDTDHSYSGDSGVLGIGSVFEDYKKCLYKNGVLENYNDGYNKAGAAKAYLFLREFLLKNQTLTHFDIAGLDGKQVKDYTYGLQDMMNVVKLVKESG